MLHYKIYSWVHIFKINTICVCKCDYVFMIGGWCFYGIFIVKSCSYIYIYIYVCVCVCVFVCVCVCEVDKGENGWIKIWSTNLNWVSTWCNDYGAGLRDRSKRLRIPVALGSSLSDKYPQEKYEPPYPPSYGLNSTTTVLLEGWI